MSSTQQPDGGLAAVLVGQVVGSIPISQIQITPRQRKIDINDKDFIAHIAVLADSIKRIGLIHPITLADETNELEAGFCRIQAFLKMGLSEIPFVRRSELTPLQKKVLELEENIARLDLKWWEQSAAIAEIDVLMREIAAEKGETWTQAKTAEAAGVSVGTVNNALQLNQELRINPGIKDHATLVGALNAIKTNKRIEERKADLALKDAGRIRTVPAEILIGDALELIRQQPDASFDAVLTNFPFGVELTLGKRAEQPYRDDEDYIVKLVRSVTHECYRVLKPHSWMVAFFDMRKITYSNKQREFVEKALHRLSQLLPPNEDGVKEFSELYLLAMESLGLTRWMEEAGFNYVQLLPCAWVKPNKSQGMIGDPNKGFIVAWEAFVLAGKGEPVLFKKGHQNFFICDTPDPSDRIMSVQMPEPLCTELVSMVALGGSRILDPFAGSGAFGLGALNCQCSFLGFELDPDRAAKGNLLLGEHIHAAAKKETT